MTDERGSALPMFTGLLFVTFVVLALVVELASFGAQWRRVADIADIAAESGAAMLDVGRLHDGSVEVDAADAEKAAVSVATSFDVPREGVSVAVGVRSVCVTISVTHTATRLRSLAVGDLPITVSRCAEPAIG